MRRALIAMLLAGAVAVSTTRPAEARWGWGGWGWGIGAFAIGALIGAALWRPAYGYGYYGMWAGAPRTYVDVNQYTEGTLILDFVDRHTKKLVFRGIGKAVVGGPESNARNIEEAVAKIVAEYPGGTKH